MPLKFLVAVAAASFAVTAWSLLTIASAAPSALLPQPGHSFSFTVKTKLQGAPMGGDAPAPQDVTSQLVVARTDVKTLKVTVHDDSETTDQSVTVNDQGSVVPPDGAPSALQVFDNAVLIASGVKPQAGYTWNEIVTLGGPPRPRAGGMPDVSRAPGPFPGGEPPRMRLAGPPQSIAVKARVASIDGTIVRVIATGMTTLDVQTPDGDGQVKVSLNVEETVTDGSIASYKETVTRSMGGMDLTTLTTLSASGTTE